MKIILIILTTVIMFSCKESKVNKAREQRLSTIQNLEKQYGKLENFEENTSEFEFTYSFQKFFEEKHNEKFLIEASLTDIIALDQLYIILSGYGVGSNYDEADYYLEINSDQLKALKSQTTFSNLICVVEINSVTNKNIFYSDTTEVSESYKKYIFKGKLIDFKIENF